MWIFTILVWWFININIISKHIKKITEGKNRSTFTPLFTVNIFIKICFFGVFMYLFLDYIRRIRYVQYLENKLDILNFANYDDKNTVEILSIERRLKLIELKQKTKKKKTSLKVIRRKTRNK